MYTINIEDVISKKEEGSVVRFSIRALPYTRRTSSFEYINEQSGRIRWCADKLSQHGLSVIGCKESSTEPLRFKRGNKYITLTSSSFVGIASVTDKGLLLNSMTTGIGREKCFGAGLLMIA